MICLRTLFPGGWIKGLCVEVQITSERTQLFAMLKCRMTSHSAEIEGRKHKQTETTFLPHFLGIFKFLPLSELQSGGGI